MDIHPLTTLPLETLHACFAQAFSDYLIPFGLSPAQLSAMLTRRGFLSAHSMGAFQGEQMQGFWLSGAGEDGDLYCISAGVIPSARRQGVLTRLFAAVDGRAAGYRQHRLEAIGENQRALDAYQQLGFTRQRRLDCFRLSEVPAPQRDWPVLCDEAPSAAWPNADWLDYPASVQNQRISLLRSNPPPRWLRAMEGGAVIGSLLMFDSGDVAELAVHPQARRRGVARALLAAAWEQQHPGYLSCTNIDSRNAPMLALLSSMRAAPTLSQWELTRPIGSRQP